MADHGEAETREAFLRASWRGVLDENAPLPVHANFERALKRLRACGIDDRDLIKVIRQFQYETLFTICNVLDEGEDPDDAESTARWALVYADEGGEILGQVEGLHEEVLSMDPTGREMRPRDPDA